MRLIPVGFTRRSPVETYRQFTRRDDAPINSVIGSSLQSLKVHRPACDASEKLMSLYTFSGKRNLWLSLLCHRRASTKRLRRVRWWYLLVRHSGSLCNWRLWHWTRGILNVKGKAKARKEYIGSNLHLCGEIWHVCSTTHGLVPRGYDLLVIDRPPAPARSQCHGFCLLRSSNLWHKSF